VKRAITKTAGIRRVDFIIFKGDIGYKEILLYILIILSGNGSKQQVY